MVTQTEITEDIFKECLEMGFNPFGSGPVPVFVRRSEEAALDATELHMGKESPLSQIRHDRE